MKWIAETLIPALFIAAIGATWLLIIAGLVDIWPERKSIGK